MRRSGYLFEKIVDYGNLHQAFRKAFRAKRSQESIAKFYFGLEHELLLLQSELITGGYEPRPYHVFEIKDPKPRKICSSHFRDRVVHHAICSVIGPIFDRRLIDDSYACRIGKGSHLAIRRLQGFTHAHPFYLKCDVRKYFESIPHDRLRALIRRIIKDPKVLGLLNRIIAHTVPGGQVGRGIPIGNLTSQYFANLYLGELDHFIKEKLRVRGYVRYMDDFICLAENKDRLWGALSEIRRFLERTLDLELKEQVVRIAPVTEGVPFLGFRVFKNLIRIQRSNLVRLRRKIFQTERAYLAGWIGEEDRFRSNQSRIGHIQWVNSMNWRRSVFEGSEKMA